MSLKIRLVLVAAAAVAAAVALASVIVYFIVRNNLYSADRHRSTKRRDPGSRPVASIPAPGPKPHEFILRGPGFGPDTGFPLPFRLVKSDGGMYLPNNYLSNALEPLAVTKARDRAGRRRPVERVLLGRAPSSWATTRGSTRRSTSPASPSRSRPRSTRRTTRSRESGSGCSSSHSAGSGSSPQAPASSSRARRCGPCASCATRPSTCERRGT